MRSLYPALLRCGAICLYFVLFSARLHAERAEAPLSELSQVVQAEMAPQITKQPEDVAEVLGGDVFLKVTASGDPSVSYRWRKNGVPIPGEQGAYNGLVFYNADASVAGEYDVVVSNSQGSVTSRKAVVTLVPLQLIPSSKQTSASRVSYSVYVHAFVPWEMSCSAPWVKLTSGRLGEESYIEVLLEPNTGATARSAELVVNGVVHKIEQRPSQAGERELWGIGSNDGAFCDGTPRGATYPLYATSGVASVAAGGGYSLVLLEDGTLMAGGRGTNGELGPSERHIQPIQLATGVKAIACGARHSLYVKNDGSLWGMGDTSSGQLGVVSLSVLKNPVQITSDVVAIYSSGYSTFCLKSDESLWGYGLIACERLSNGTIVPQATPIKLASEVSSVSAYGEHVLFVKKDGTLWAAGANSYGQLGTGNKERVSVPVKVMENVASVATGEAHSLILMKDGRLLSVGNNTYGQLGDGSTTDRLNPVPVATDVAAIAAGFRSSAYVKSNGSLYTMGYNSEGQLGDGTTVNRSSPKMVARNVLAVSMFYGNTMFITSGSSEVLRIVSNPVSQSVQEGTSASLSVVTVGPDSARYQWRHNGMDIPGATSATYTIPKSSFEDAGEYSVRIDGVDEWLESSVATLTVLSPPTFFSSPADTSGLSGSGLTLSVIADGSPAPNIVWRKDGQVIPGVTGSTFTLYPLSDANIGVYDAVVTNSSGSVVTAPARVSVVPALVQPLSRIVGPGRVRYPVKIQCAGAWEATTTASWIRLFPNPRSDNQGFLEVEVEANITNADRSADVIIAGVKHVLTQRAAGTPVRQLWVAGSVPLTGLGEQGGTSRLDPISLLEGVESVSEGNALGLAVKSDGTAWSYGRMDVRNFPAPTLFGTDIAAVSVGGGHFLVLKKDGVLWAGGDNTKGQLGIGSKYLNPIMVRTLANVAAVAAGVRHSLILKKDGTLWGCGQNSAGQLGDGSSTDRFYPVPIDSGVSQIAAFDNHSLYLKSDDSLWGMGENGAGELGDGSVTDRKRPVLIARDVVSFATGGSHSLYVTKDGSLWTMGSSRIGAPTNNKSAVYLVPIKVASDVKAAASGRRHSVFLKNDGTVWTYGWNDYGQLGDRTTTTRDEPTLIARNSIAVFCGELSTYYLTEGESAVFHISEQPKDGEVALGARHQFSVGVLGDASASYQWFKDAEPIPGATRAILQLDNVRLDHWGSYHVVVTSNGLSQVSKAAKLRILTPPTIKRQPVELTAVINFTGVLSVVAEGSPLPSYQWRKNGTPLQGERYTSSALQFNGLRASDEGTYDVVVSNSQGQTISNAVYVRPVTALVAPADKVIGENGGSYFVGVESASDWSASSDSSWVSVVKEGGPDSVLVTVEPNTTKVSRSATLTLGGVVHRLTQNAAGDPLRELWRSGKDQAGMLGYGWTDSLRIPVQVLSKVRAVSVNYGTALYVLEDGSLYSQGYNAYGQAGDGAVKTRYSLFKVDTGVVAARSGWASLYLKEDGTLWGMGNGISAWPSDTAPFSNPLPRALASDVVSFTTFQSGVFFVTKDGTLWKSDMPVKSSTQPKSIASGVKQVSAGSEHLCFVKSDGTLWGMGENYRGQLANDDPTEKTSPVQMSSGVLSVSCGYSHTLFMKTDGSLWGVGSNGSGELGEGGGTDRTTPVRISEDVKEYTAGNYSSFFTKGDGSLWWTGSDTFGLYRGEWGFNVVVPTLLAKNVVALDNGGGSAYISIGSIGGAHTLPQISGQLQDRVIGSNESATLIVTASGPGVLRYQWYRNGVPLPDQTLPRLTIYPFSREFEGVYHVVVSNEAGSVSSNPVTLSVERSHITALSVRAEAGTGENTLILGFLLGGNGTKPTILRGLGPFLATELQGYLQDPRLSLFGPKGAQLLDNDNWEDTEDLRKGCASIGMTPPPAGSRDAATIQRLNESLYTMHISSSNGGTGIALAEVYDAAPNDRSKLLTAVSVRNYVGTGDKILISGIIVSGTAKKKLLVRGIGPGLPNTITNRLADPMLKVYSFALKRDIAQNDNWEQDPNSGTAMAQLKFAPLPAGSLDSAMVLVVEPGVYTVSLVGKDNTTGVGLIEIYELD